MAKQRLDKILSGLGEFTRSECKKACKSGRIQVNGETVVSSDIKVDPDTDSISIDGRLLNSQSFVYYMLNKPSGVITAKHDANERCVMDLIDDSRKDLTAVGRLDKDTTGLLLITNDGDMNHRLLSPAKHVPKRYVTVIDGHLTPQEIALLTDGIDIGDDTPTKPAIVDILNDETPQSVALTITEGRYHQVKRMFAAVGTPVLTLHRSEFGPLKLDEGLAPGEYRPLTQQEIELLR